LDKDKSLVIRSVRLAWIVVAVVMIVVVAVTSAEIPAVVLALMSFPAGLLANFLAPFSFPVRVVGLPDPEVLVVPVAMGVLGFIQWFVVVPRIAAKLSDSVRRALVVLVVWVLAQAATILVSMPLNRVTGKMVCEVNAILFHAWLAIPATVAAAAGGLAVSSLVDRQPPRRWTLLLGCLFFVASAALQANVLFDEQSTSNRIGVLLEVLLPGCACILAGSFASRSRQERGAGVGSQ